MNGPMDSPDPTGQPKAELRRLWRWRRQQAMAAGAGTAILAAVQRWLAAEPPGPGHLGLYWPLTGEPDLRPLALLHGGPLALPAVEEGPTGARLVYRPWRRGLDLVADACGIPAPPPAPPLAAEDLAVLLVPALACDGCGIRLGYGGGWYDRLRADPAWRRRMALMVLPRCCRVARLPADAWDVPFNGWIDEQGPMMVSNP
ncbi:MAG: 5-formyltetrahydrofolate cyclo-ligase [Cyanobacteriota bacterium]|nr:5-formyltetrahydrofolate cyclo-ligase [Cyanobacteriota bacterium]